MVQKFIPEITLINNGIQDEIGVPVDLDINRWIPPVTGTWYMNEAFGSWVPAGWTYYGGWSQSYTSYAGGTSPEARLYWGSAYGNDYLMSDAVDTTGASSLELIFNSYTIHHYISNFCWK